MKNATIAIVSLGAVLAGLFLWYQRGDAPELIGGQTDDHGCLVAAGYSWSDEKQQCVRPWEEAIKDTITRDLQEQFAEKYSRPASDASIDVLKIEENHAAGTVVFGQGGPGEAGIFLAVKTDGKWRAVFDGNGSIDCGKMRQEYSFPDAILKPEFCD